MLVFVEPILSHHILHKDHHILVSTMNIIVIIISSTLKSELLHHPPIARLRQAARAVGAVLGSVGLWDKSVTEL